MRGALRAQVAGAEGTRRGAEVLACSRLSGRRASRRRLGAERSTGGGRPAKGRRVARETGVPETTIRRVGAPKENGSDLAHDAARLFGVGVRQVADAKPETVGETALSDPPGPPLHLCW